MLVYWRVQQNDSFFEDESILLNLHLFFGRNSNTVVESCKKTLDEHGDFNTIFQVPFLGWQTFECLLRTQTPNSRLITQIRWFRIFGRVSFLRSKLWNSGLFVGFLGHGESSWIFHSNTIKKIIRPYKGWKKPYSPGWKRRSGGNFVDWSWLWGRWVLFLNSNRRCFPPKESFEFHSWWICAKFAFFFLAVVLERDSERNERMKTNQPGLLHPESQILTRCTGCSSPKDRHTELANRSRLSICHPCAWRLLDQGMPQSLVCIGLL